MILSLDKWQLPQVSGFVAPVLPADAPPMPWLQPDKAVSPFEVGQEAFVAQVANAEVFLQWCRKAIDSFDEYMQVSPPDVQDEIAKMLRELAGKVQQGARVQAIGEASVEVAAHVRMSLK